MSGCYCDYDDDIPEFYSVKVINTRKVSKCSECGNEIPAGSMCERASGKWNGDVLTFRMCQECMEFRNWAEAHIPCLKECPAPFTALHITILDQMQEWDQECPGLYAEAKAKSLAIRKRNQPETVP